MWMNKIICISRNMAKQCIYEAQDERFIHCLFQIQQMQAILSFDLNKTSGDKILFRYPLKCFICFIKFFIAGWTCRSVTPLSSLWDGAQSGWVAIMVQIRRHARQKVVSFLNTQDLSPWWVLAALSQKNLLPIFLSFSLLQSITS